MTSTSFTIVQSNTRPERVLKVLPVTLGSVTDEVINTQAQKLQVASFQRSGCLKLYLKPTGISLFYVYGLFNVFHLGN